MGKQCNRLVSFRLDCNEKPICLIFEVDIDLVNLSGKEKAFLINELINPYSLHQMMMA